MPYLAKAIEADMAYDLGGSFQSQDTAFCFLSNSCTQECTPVSRPVLE